MLVDTTSVKKVKNSSSPRPEMLGIPISSLYVYSSLVKSHALQLKTEWPGPGSRRLPGTKFCYSMYINSQPLCGPNISNYILWTFTIFNEYLVEPTHLKKYANVKLGIISPCIRVKQDKSSKNHHLPRPSISGAKWFLKGCQLTIP